MKFAVKATVDVLKGHLHISIASVAVRGVAGRLVQGRLQVLKEDSPNVARDDEYDRCTARGRRVTSNASVEGASMCNFHCTPLSCLYAADIAQTFESFWEQEKQQHCGETYMACWQPGSGQGLCSCPTHAGVPRCAWTRPACT